MISSSATASVSSGTTTCRKVPVAGECLLWWELCLAFASGMVVVFAGWFLFLADSALIDDGAPWSALDGEGTVSAGVGRVAAAQGPCDFETTNFEDIKSTTFLEPVVVRNHLHAFMFDTAVGHLEAQDRVIQNGSVQAFATEGPSAGKSELSRVSGILFSQFKASNDSTLFETIFKVDRGEKVLGTIELPGRFVGLMQQYFEGNFFVQLLASTMKQGFTPHVHGEAFFMHVQGPKRWRVNKRNSWPLFVNSTSGKLNTNNLTLEGFLNRPGTTECVLRPGDLLYLPHYYPHTVENLDDFTLGFQVMGMSLYLNTSVINRPGNFLHV